MSAPSGTATVPTTKRERERPDRPEAAARATKERSAKAGRPVAASEASRLGNTQAGFPDGQRRQDRHVLRVVRQQQTGCSDSGRKCGRVTILPKDHPHHGYVQVRAGSAETPAGFGGLATCGSVWACPVCAAKIAAKRVADMEALAAWAHSEGHALAMITLTVRHHGGHGLGEVWDAVRAGWHAVTSGRAWISDQEMFGVRGWVRAVEVTHGDHGWHVHVHALVVLASDKSGKAPYKLGLRLWTRWERGLTRKGFTALRDQGGLDVRVNDPAMGLEEFDPRYPGKGVGDGSDARRRLALEVANGQGKTGTGDENRHPFEILAGLEVDPSTTDAALWREWEAASKGRRQLTWSKGMRDLAGLDAEVTDEEAAAEQVADGEIIALIPQRAWWRMASVGWALLDVIDGSGAAAGREWLAAHGVSWVCPPGCVLEITGADRWCVDPPALLG